MPNPKRARAEVEREARRKSVSAYFLAGVTYRQMAEALGVSLGTIAADVDIILKRWQAEQVQNIEGKVTLQSARLDVALKSIWSKVIGGQEAAVDRLLAIVDRYAKLHGLYAPTKVAPTTPDGQEPYDPQAALSDLEAVFARLAEVTKEPPHDDQPGPAVGTPFP